MIGELWAVLAGVAALVAGGAFARAHRRRPSGAGRTGAIQLLTSRYLGGKRFLTLVEVEGERLLLALAGDSVSLVARLGSGGQGRAREPGAGPAGEGR